MYKLYKTGQEFLDENIDLIRGDRLGTTFFEANANAIAVCDDANFALRVQDGSEVLIAIRVNGYPLVVYGSTCCANELATAVSQNKLQFSKVIGYYDIVTAFLNCYEQLVGGSHKVNLSMDIMYCQQVNSCDTSQVEQATAHDVDEIAQMVVDFTTEAVNEAQDFNAVRDKVASVIDRYALIRINGEIVSMGYFHIDGELCRISNVYTKPSHRNRGYSRKVVTYITQQAIDCGYLPCLHVDQHNPISNHLYSSIGYVYGKSRYEMEFVK